MLDKEYLFSGGRHHHLYWNLWKSSKLTNQKWARILKSRWRAKWEINLKLFLRGLDLTDDSTLASKMHSNVRISFGEKVTEANTWPWGGMSAFWGSISKMSWIFDELLLFSAFTLKFTSQLFYVFILVLLIDGTVLCWKGHLEQPRSWKVLNERVRNEVGKWQLQNWNVLNEIEKKHSIKKRSWKNLIEVRSIDFWKFNRTWIDIAGIIFKVTFRS